MAWKANRKVDIGDQKSNDKRSNGRSDPPEVSAEVSGQLEGPSARASLAALWLYTLLRFAIFFGILGLLWLIDVRGFLGAVIALVLSLPISFVLLAKPRARLASNLEQRLQSRRARESEFDARLVGDDTQD
jgi:hypothetical protein